MEKIYVVLIGSHGMELDRIEVSVADTANCGKEVSEAIHTARWVLSIGDRVEVQERPQ